MPPQPHFTHTLIGVLALRIYVVLLNELPIIVIRLRLRLRPRHLPHAIRRPPRGSFTRGSLLRDRVAGVDPVCIDVDGRRQVVDVCLEGLAANFTLQVADA
jgi:hypothetical protein